MSNSSTFSTEHEPKATNCGAPPWDERAKYAQLYKQAENLPDGYYMGKIEAVYVTTKGEDTPLIVWLIRVIDGDHSGKLTAKFNTLSSQRAKEFFAEELRKLGVMAKSRNAFIAQRDKVIGKVIPFTVKTAPEGYKSIRIKGPSAASAAPVETSPLW